MPSHGNGPVPARLMIVGEAWGADEDRAKQPFVGASGQELNRMLQEVGILRSECYVTNLVNERPPNNDIGAWIAMKKKDITLKHTMLRDKYVLPIVVDGFNSLQAEINAVKPNVILALGNSAMWALSGNWGILRWRGSLLKMDFGADSWTRNANYSVPKLIPSIHPAAILREWSLRSPAIRDFRRVQEHMDSREYSPPAWSFIIRPSFPQVMEVLNALLIRLKNETVWIDFDLETARGHITCAGISWSRTEALCIPFTVSGQPDGYWSLEEESVILFKLRALLTHPRANIRGQNLLYDCQYTYRHWHFIPRVAQDTMISHHSTFSGMKKSLDFQASLYVQHYTQWKPEKGQWKDGG